ncbi:MAG: LysR family transcriptional regulator [Alcaligenaceae bacterium]|nr:LysR family transcriptional regulator [Alcaligenaceae bacterium SAGV5]MPS50733.1 LysR family transcriptional regulator [Alcaligenaceae bacterium SAGV3]MPT57071.1 LysR family transcriptional regulator [Alcaligenaceae bacterium]
MNKDRPISLAGLRGFVLAARQGSFTKAAEELCLTQSALSRQIQALESELGERLFVRTTRVLKLTEAGAKLEKVAVAMLDQLDGCVSQIRRGSAKKRVTISSFSSFISMWLIPRLGALHAAHPDIDLHFQATDRFVDLDTEDVDVAIRYCTPDTLPSTGQVLTREEIYPVGSNTVAANIEPGLDKAFDPEGQTLLLQESTTSLYPWSAWATWLPDTATAETTKSLRFTNHDQIIQATMLGQGVALGRHVLIEYFVESGLLRRLSPVGIVPPQAYCLLVSERAKAVPEVELFIEWLKSEIRIGNASPQ